MRNWSLILVGMLAGCTATKSAPEHATMVAANAMPNPHME